MLKQRRVSLNDKANREYLIHHLKQCGCRHVPVIDDDPGFAVYEVNLRAELPNMISQLSRTDVATVYQVARLLSLPGGEQ